MYSVIGHGSVGEDDRLMIMKQKKAGAEAHKEMRNGRMEMGGSRSS